MPIITNEQYILILEEEINYLNSKNRSEWAITLTTNNKVRLHFGNFIVFTIENDPIWTAINKDDSKHLDNLNFWVWDQSDYPEYSQHGLFSKNGFFSGNHGDWNKIKKYHFNFINKIADRKYKLDCRTKKNHDNSVLIKLMGQIDKSLPLPSFVINEEINKIQKEIKLVDFSKYTETEKEIITKNRIGQNIFRDNLLFLHKKCLICGLANKQILKASHIKPWRKCSSSERLNPNNGLLLCANHDLLFDRFLITFAENGNIIISKSIKSDLKQLLISDNIKININSEQNEFMEWHRKKFYAENN